MLLTRIVVNPYSSHASRMTRPYHAHTILESIFPDETHHPRLLFRVEENPFTNEMTVLVQSQYHPAADWLMQNPKFAISINTKPYNPIVNTGDRLLFRLLASPVLRSNGKQLPYSPEHDSSWLAHRQKGFRVLSATSTTQNLVEIASTKYPRYCVPAVQYDGVLEVTDPTEMLATIQCGIGRSRHLGFGMLSLAKC